MSGGWAGGVDLVAAEIWVGGRLLSHSPPRQRLLLPLPQAKDVLSVAGKGGVQAVAGGQGHVAAHRLQVESRHMHHLITSSVIGHWEEGRYGVVVVVGG